MIIEERLRTFINSLDRGNAEWLDEVERQALSDRVPIVRKEMQGLLRFLLAAQNPDQGAREEMKDILDKIDLCQAKERVKLDKQFHDHLIKISGNHLLVLLNEALSELFETMISDYTLHITQKNWDRLLDCHRRVYDCLIKNAVQEGVKAIREHYNIIDEDLKEYQIGE